MPSVAVVGILVGVLVGMGIYILGMLIAAQGQVLVALLDTALNTSPYLDADTRAMAMSLANPVNTSTSKAWATSSDKQGDKRIFGLIMDEAECPWCHTKGAQTVESDSGVRVRCCRCSREYEM
jgi:hypothetical protein